MIVKESSGTNLPPIEAGLHQAVCYALIDLGTHYSEKFDKTSHQLMLMWEFPDVRLDTEKDGEKKSLPRVISKKYTMSLGERANLRKDLKSWRGRDFTPEELEGFELKQILGVNCIMQIIHNSKDGKTYGNIETILPLMKNYKTKKPENPILYFNMSEGLEIPEMPKWIVEIIKSSKEFEGIAEMNADLAKNIETAKAGDVPF
jgi:hypothetical protein